jgi:SET domain-containing protein
MRAMNPGKKPGPHINERIASFRLRLDRSRIHRFGVFAAETIPAHRKVIEYTGERISRRESRRRFLKILKSSGKPMLYLFRVDRRWVLDGSVGGSGAEYINHCCEPNLRACNEGGRIFYKSCRRIMRGEELTVDYQFPRNGPKMRCRCGARNCRGTVNLK